MAGTSLGVIVSAAVLVGSVAPATAGGAEDAPARPSNPYADNTQVLSEGNSLFNQFCSHCHGPNTVQGERPRDLRRLQLRYGDDAISVFYTTINNGRIDKGMPVWKGVLSEEVVWKIYTYLASVQTRP